MKIQLSRLTVHSPDEVLPYWFVSEDFAELLGSEFSKEAAIAIRSAVAQRGVSVDYESSAVTLRISKKEQVLPTLSSLYALLEWDQSELVGIRQSIESFKRPRPRTVSIGDIFEVPVAAGLVGLGQVLDLNFKAPTVAVFQQSGPLGGASPAELSRSQLLTILHINGTSLVKGDWPIIGAAVPVHEPASGPGGRFGAVGCRSYGGDGPVVVLLEAVAGRRSWTEGFADPKFLRGLLMS